MSIAIIAKNLLKLNYVIGNSCYIFMHTDIKQKSADSLFKIALNFRNYYCRIQKWTKYISVRNNLWNAPNPRKEI